MNGTITQMFQDYKLTETEKNIYFYLTSQGPQKVITVSKGLHLHKMQVYRLLLTMEKKGVIRRTYESPRRYLSVSIEELYDENIIRLSERVQSFRFLRNEAIEEGNLSFKRIQFDTNSFCILENWDQSFSRVKKLASAAKETVLIGNPIEMAFHQAGHEEFVKNRNAVEIQLLWLGSKDKLSQLSSSQIKILKKLTSTSGLEIRVHDSIETFGIYIVVDNSEGGIHLNDIRLIKKEELPILFTNNPILVQTIKAFHQELWNEAIDLNSLLNLGS